jgi:hypothetical protein
VEAGELFQAELNRLHQEWIYDRDRTESLASLKIFAEKPRTFHTFGCRDY